MTNTYSKIPAILFLLLFVNLSYAQSPKKYYKNGYYEKAFTEATKKQNKKIKLKKKHAQIIQDSYAKMYTKHQEKIAAAEVNWNQSYEQLVRIVSFRNMVKHPLIIENLNNMLNDPLIQNRLISKFNTENTEAIELSNNYESVSNYVKALEIYEAMAKRHDQASQISTIKDRCIFIDHAGKTKQLHQLIGDQLIEEAKENILAMTQQGATLAIDLIEKARRHRPLSLEEEDLKNLANLIIGDSWIGEARKLIETGTKKNARLAYELITRARNKRALNAEEEQLLEKAELIGTTRVYVSVSGEDHFNTSEQISGALNKQSTSKWVSYHFIESDNYQMDLVLNLKENKPVVVLGKTHKRITQNSKQVEYYEDEINAAGDTVKVKKTRTAIAVVAISSKKKHAQIDWSLSLKQIRNDKVIQSEIKESRVELIHEYASLESGDILALPENIETEVDLDSQPFPSDEDMIKQVKDLYFNDLFSLKLDKKVEELD